MNHRPNLRTRTTAFAYLLAVVGIFAFSAGALAENDSAGPWDFVLEDSGAVITGYKDIPEGDLLLSDVLDGHPVTSLGEYALAWYDDLTGVIIPEGVTGIGEEAFSECESLENVILPTSVIHIGEFAFKDCENLVLYVTEGSYAKQYAEDNSMAYECAE